MREFVYSDLLIAKFISKIFISIFAIELPIIGGSPRLSQPLELAWLVDAHAVIHKLITRDLGLVVVQELCQSQAV